MVGQATLLSPTDDRWKLLKIICSALIIVTIIGVLMPGNGKLLHSVVNMHNIM